jgi:RIO kinase 1
MRKTTLDDELDPIAYYEQRYNITIDDERPQSRRRKPAASYQEQVNALAEPTPVEAGLPMTYTPSRFERPWLEGALRGFYDRELIADVLSMVKGGKEACVYRCVSAGPISEPLVAAKVYRPRQFRNLRNDSAYLEGRAPLTLSGKALTERDQREMRAIAGRTRFGETLRHTSWLMYEFTAMQTLYAAGADVPQPHAVEANAILMAFVGDEHAAAPTLNAVRLGRNRARALFERVLNNIEIMLQHGMVHGDLSAYNILYWDDAPQIIDLPQVTLLEGNRRSQGILARDVQRVCEYFARQGVDCDAKALATDLWRRYGADESWAARDYDLSLLEKD